MDWFDLTALELGAKIQAGEVSAVDAARACLARIEEKEPTVHAFVTVTPEAALARAEAVQKRIDSGELTHPLAGVPMAVATDCNPGSSPLDSLTLAMNMACTLFRMTPLEALQGTTNHKQHA